MSITNIIIIAVIIIIILWVLTSTISKTNIVMDMITECNVKGKVPSGDDTSLLGTSSTNPNYVSNKIISTSSNIMISVWFYIETWDTIQSNETKNILYLTTNPSSNFNNNGAFDSRAGDSLTDLSCVNRVNNYKNFSVELDKYENNIFIYVLCANTDRCDTGEDILSKYKISNIPIQKWNNLTLSVDAKLLDVYLDGKLLNSFVLPSLLKMDSNSKPAMILGHIDDSLTSNWNGFITRVRYETNSITPKEALSIYKAGISSNHTNSLLSKYSLKISFLEYNEEKGHIHI